MFIPERHTPQLSCCGTVTLLVALLAPATWCVLEIYMGYIFEACSPDLAWVHRLSGMSAGICILGCYILVVSCKVAPRRTVFTARTIFNLITAYAWCQLCIPVYGLVCVLSETGLQCRSHNFDYWLYSVVSFIVVLCVMPCFLVLCTLRIKHSSCLQ